MPCEGLINHRHKGCFVVVCRSKGASLDKWYAERPEVVHAANAHVAVRRRLTRAQRLALDLEVLQHMAGSVSDDIGIKRKRGSDGGVLPTRQSLDFYEQLARVSSRLLLRPVIGPIQYPHHGENPCWHRSE